MLSVQPAPAGERTLDKRGLIEVHPPSNPHARAKEHCCTLGFGQQLVPSNPHARAKEHDVPRLRLSAALSFNPHVRAKEHREALDIRPYVQPARAGERTRHPLRTATSRTPSRLVQPERSGERIPRWGKTQAQSALPFNPNLRAKEHRRTGIVATNGRERPTRTCGRKNTTGGRHPLRQTSPSNPNLRAKEHRQ